MKRSIGAHLVFVALLVLVLLFLVPFLLVLLNSFKSYAEIVSSVVSLPTTLNFDNFVSSFNRMNYPSAFLNTLLVTVLGVGGIVLVSSLAGFQIARHKTKLSKTIFFLLIIPMMIPFQSFMISLVKVSSVLGLIGSDIGLALLYWGLGAPMAVFLYRGYSIGVPRELDEAAMIDGCDSLQAFFRIIFPVLKPINATVVVINAMWLWNDFLLPLLIIGGNKDASTLQLTAYAFMGQYKMEWQNIMSSVILVLIPALIIYLVFQKYIISGMVAGAVKG